MPAGVADPRATDPAAPAAPAVALQSAGTTAETKAGTTTQTKAGTRVGKPAPPPQLLVRRAVSLLLLTLVLPGSAQWLAGDRRVAKAALGVVAGAVAIGVVLALAVAVDLGGVLALFTSSALLRMLAVLVVAVAVGEIALLVDAWRLGRPAALPRRARPLVAAGTALAVLLIAAGGLAGARRAWAGADLLDDVFHAGEASGAVDGRYTVLLLGGDAGPDRVGTRPDSVTVASIDAVSGRTVLFSLPRNLEDVPFAPGSAARRALPNGWSCGDSCLLNAIYTWGATHAGLFPGARDPGAEAMKEAVSGITGLTVNYYVLIDLQGFRQLVDAMGGITLTVRQPVPIGGGTSPVKGYITPGTQHLDGYHALWFARSRHGANDYARMQRQRCVMNAMLHQLDPADVLANFEGIAAASSQVVSTDLPAGELGRFVSLAAGARSQPLTSVQFVPPLLDPAHPDMPALQAKVADTLRTATATANAPAPNPSPAATPKAAVIGAARRSAGSVGSRTSPPPGAPTGGQDAGGVPATNDVQQVCSAG